MPPVLGPVSPSPMRLWSCAGTSGVTCLPSLRQRKLISSPSRNSSMTTWCSASPSSAPEKRPCAASIAVLARRADDDALARGQPVGLDHDGRMKDLDGLFDFGRGGADGVVGRGNVVALQETLGEAFAGFEHGGGARGTKDAQAALAGARRRCPARAAAPGRRWSARAARASARRTMASRSLRSTGTQRAICAMPPLPGAQTTSVTRGLRATAQASACSRPPEPRIKTFIALPFPPYSPRPEKLWSAMGVGEVKRAKQTEGNRSIILPC